MHELLCFLISKNNDLCRPRQPTTDMFIYVGIYMAKYLVFGIFEARYADSRRQVSGVRVLMLAPGITHETGYIHTPLDCGLCIHVHIHIYMYIYM